MVSDPTAWMKEEYEKLVEQGLDWRLRTLEGPNQPRAVVDGKKVIMLCSNNYLNLSTHPKLLAAAKKAVDTHGAGSGSVRPIAGNMDLHEELEQRIAKFKRTESSLFYMSGFAANAGIVSQLAGEGDLYVSDELNHGSIIDGCRTSKADRVIYKHCDMASLEEALKKAQSEKRKRVVVLTDGVFSMDGDVAPVDAIVKLCEKYGAISYVDDAHGEGVLGDGGRGVASHFHMEGRVNLEMGTFSKAFGVVGGYIAGAKHVREYALNKSRSWLLSGSHPPAVVASCIAALDVMESEPQHLKNLWDNTRYWKKELVSLGFDIGNSVTPITPVMCGESHTAKKMADRLFELGVFGIPIVYPMVARDKARIRTIITAGLKREDLDEALRAFEKAGKEVQLV